MRSRTLGQLLVRIVLQPASAPTAEGRDNAGSEYRTDHHAQAGPLPRGILEREKEVDEDVANTTPSGAGSATSAIPIGLRM